MLITPRICDSVFVTSREVQNMAIFLIIPAKLKHLKQRKSEVT